MSEPPPPIPTLEGGKGGVGGGLSPQMINMINISPVLSTFWRKKCLKQGKC